jgi:hypothetical protein
LADIQDHAGQFHGHHQIKVSIVGVGQFEKVNHSVVGHSYGDTAANSATANKLKNIYKYFNPKLTSFSWLLSNPRDLYPCH